MSADEERRGLLSSGEPSQSAPLLGGPLVSWNQFWTCVVPILVAALALPSVFGLWYVSAGIGALLLLYLAVIVVILFCFRNSFQLWALQRPWNCLVRLLLPPVEIIDSLGSGNTDYCMWKYRSWGENLCASAQVWIGSHKEISKALTNPQARNNWLGEHPLYRGSLPEGPSGRCVFLLSLSNKAAGGTGDHEAFRKCMIDTLFNDAAVARETDEISKQLISQAAENYVKESEFEFYHGTEGTNTVFWTKYLHHVLFGLNIKDGELLKTLDAFYDGASALMHYLEPFGRLPCFSNHAGIGKVADLYEKSPSFANFQVKPEYNNMTARELALLMTSIIRIAGVQGSRMLLWLCTSGSLHGNLQVDARPIWDSLNLDDDDEVERFILEVSRLSPPVTISSRISTEPFSCEINGKTYSFPQGTMVGIPLVYGNIDPTVWGDDAFDFNHRRPGLRENHVGFNSVNGVGPRECPGKGLVLRTTVRLLQAMGKKRRQQSATA
ncbi:CYP714B2 [Symbiodinium natans]|uniref:CYP714B2 protein n=1 Tax=Symbiodinium natans TaxID=878477 RepID=A0A812SNN7_9DINO|nr:CYP714B2 [Symbiodinium natans]